MIEDFFEKRKAVNKIIEQMRETLENKNYEKLKELMDSGFAASLEQSLSIAKEISTTKGILRKGNIPQDYRVYLEKKKDLLKECYIISAMEMRLITIVGQKYGLTKAPTE